MEEKTKDILIQKIMQSENDFIAYCKADLLQATFCVVFKDTIFGAVAVNEFYQMVQRKYSTRRVRLVLSDKELKVMNPGLLKHIRCDGIRGGIK